MKANFTGAANVIRTVYCTDAIAFHAENAFVRSQRIIIFPRNSDIVNILQKRLLKNGE